MTETPERMPDRMPIKLVDNPSSACHGMYICAAGGTPYVPEARLTDTTSLLDEAVRALEPFAKQADGRRRKDMHGAVCFGQDHLIAARAAIAKIRSKT